jgi:hypothetical protein
MLTLSKSFINNNSNINCSNINCSNINCSNINLENNLSIGKQLSDSYNYSDAALTLTNQIPIISTTNADNSVSVLDLCRQGTSAQSFGARASFYLTRHTISSTKSNTLLDLKLSHNSYDDNSVIKFYSTGNVNINNLVKSKDIILQNNGKINSGNDYNFIQFSDINNNITIQSESIIYFNIGNSTGTSFNVNSTVFTLANGNLIVNNTTNFQSDLNCAVISCNTRWVRVTANINYDGSWYYFYYLFTSVNLIKNKTYLVDVIITLNNVLLNYQFTQIVNNIGSTTYNNVLQKNIIIININPANIFWDIPESWNNRLWVYVSTSSVLANAIAQITITSLG